MLSEESGSLVLHTLESLCDELVSGRAVVLDERGGTLVFEKRTRAVFNWYRQNRGKWGGQNRTDQVEQIVGMLDTEPPVVPRSAGGGEGAARTSYHVREVRIARFAGLQDYGHPGEIVFSFEKPMTVLYGRNGTGKTAFLSALSWCLSGCIYRSQREPELGNTPVPIDWDGARGAGGEDDSEGEAYVARDMAAVTPMPSAEVLASLGGKALPLDTRVEVDLVPEGGGSAVKLMRHIKRNPRGGIAETQSGFEKLALDPMALEVGTRLPALIPYIDLASGNDWGKALAGLTGLKPLEDLVRHARKSCEKLRGELPKKAWKDIESRINPQIASAAEELEALLAEHEEIRPSQAIPKPGDSDIAERLVPLRSHFLDLESKLFQEARRALGDGFDPASETARRNLRDCVGPALGQMKPTQLQKLRGIATLGALRGLTPEQQSAAEALVQSLLTEANEVAKLAREPERAARQRLYARVGHWMREHAGEGASADNCPVCARYLGTVEDPVTGQPVRQSLQEACQQDKEHLAQSIREWARTAAGRLRSELPPALSNELSRDLPEHPVALLREAILVEFFEDRSVFGGTLGALKDAITPLVEQSLRNAPPLGETALPAFPKEFAETDVELLCRRATRAIAFARWRQQNGSFCRDIHHNLLEKTENGGAQGSWNLPDRLEALNQLVETASPLAEAVKKVERMERHLQERRAIEEKIVKYDQAADALEPLFALRAIVNDQVSAVMTRISERTQEWKSTLYRGANPEGPAMCRVEVEPNEKVGIYARHQGTSAPAMHISNASDLRATLLALLFAYWEYLYYARGGISLMLLDDVHELFDDVNRDNLASALPELVNAGARVVVTTNNDEFRARLAECATEQIGPGGIDQRQMQPLSPDRRQMVLGPIGEADKESKSPVFVVCIRNEGHEASLELHKIYRTLPDEQARSDGDIRIVDESGENFQYSASCFAPIDPPPAVVKSLLRGNHE